MGLLSALKLQELETKLSPMLVATGRAAAVSTNVDPAARLAEQDAFDKSRDERRAAHLSDVYSKTEIAFNKRQMELAYAAKQKAPMTPQYQRELDLAKAEVDTPAVRENLRRSLSGEKDGTSVDTGPAIELKINDAIKKLVDRKANDAVGAVYGAKVNGLVLQKFTAHLTHAPSDDELKDPANQAKINGFAQEALAELEENNPEIGRVGLAHYDSRHTKPTETDMLGRVGNAVSPDLKQKSTATSSFPATVLDATAPGGSRTVSTPVYAGQDSSGSGAAVDAVKNRRNEVQTNKVSTVKSPEAGLFVIEDAMAQAWEQVRLDKTAQNMPGEAVSNLTYEFGEYRGDKMTYEGGLGDTYAAPAGVGLGGQNSNTRTDHAKVTARLSAVTQTRDNASAKLVIKPDTLRGGYDPYTMFSQIPDVANPTDTGMRSFTRDNAGVRQVAGSHPVSAKMDWEAAAKKQASAAAQKMATRQGVATTAVADAKLAETAKQAAQQVADQGYAKSIKDNFANQPQDAILAAAKESAGAAAKVANLTDIRTDANAVVAKCNNQIAGLTAQLAASRTVLMNAETAAKALGRRCRHACKPSLRGRCDQGARRLRRARQGDRRPQPGRSAGRDSTTQASRRLPERRHPRHDVAEKKIEDAVLAAGLVLTDPKVVDLIAKARAKAKAAQDLELATSMVATAQAVLARVTDDAKRAREDSDRINAGRGGSFPEWPGHRRKSCGQTRSGNRGQRRRHPEAKTKALEDMLAAAGLAAKTASDEREASRVEAELVSIKIAMEAKYTVIAAQQKLANATTGREKLEVEIADAEKLIASVTGGRDLQLVVGERNTARDNKAWAYGQLATKDGSPAAPAPGLDGAKQAELDAKQKQQDAETLALSAGTKAADAQTAANGAMDTATSASGKVDEITKRAGELDKLVARHKELSTIIAAAQERLVDAPPGLTDDVEQELASAKKQIGELEKQFGEGRDFKAASEQLAQLRTELTTAQERAVQAGKDATAAKGEADKASKEKKDAEDVAAAAKLLAGAAGELVSAETAKAEGARAVAPEGGLADQKTELIAQQAVEKAASQAALAREADRVAIEAFETARQAAISDQRLVDESETLRAEAEALALAADVGTAKAAGTKKLNDARKALSDKLLLLNTALGALAQAGDGQRGALARLAALTREQSLAAAEMDTLTKAAADPARIQKAQDRLDAVKGEIVVFDAAVHATAATRTQRENDTSATRIVVADARKDLTAAAAP